MGTFPYRQDEQTEECGHCEKHLGFLVALCLPRSGTVLAVDTRIESVLYSVPVRVRAREDLTETHSGHFSVWPVMREIDGGFLRKCACAVCTH